MKIDWFIKFFYHITWCKFGIHHKVIHHDDWGIAGHWTCSCCGYDCPAIVWLGPPLKDKITH